MLPAALPSGKKRQPAASSSLLILIRAVASFMVLPPNASVRCSLAAAYGNGGAGLVICRSCLPWGPTSYACLEEVFVNFLEVQNFLVTTSDVVADHKLCE